MHISVSEAQVLLQATFTHDTDLYVNTTRGKGVAPVTVAMFRTEGLTHSGNSPMTSDSNTKNNFFTYSKIFEEIRGLYLHMAGGDDTVLAVPVELLSYCINRMNMRTAQHAGVHSMVNEVLKNPRVIESGEWADFYSKMFRWQDQKLSPKGGCRPLDRLLRGVVVSSCTYVTPKWRKERA